MHKTDENQIAYHFCFQHKSGDNLKVLKSLNCSGIYLISLGYVCFKICKMLDTYL